MKLRSLLLATTSAALLVTGITPIASAAPTTTGNNTTKLSATPPDPTVMMTVAKRTEVSKSGRLRVRGTYSCADAENKTSELGGSVSQWRGQTQVIGSFSITPLECDGAGRPS